MEVIYRKNNNMLFQNGTGVGLGNFDGLHIGHMTLIHTLINESKFNNLDSVLYTFTKHPENILRKKFLTPLLTTEAKKVELLRTTALDYLYFDEFDENYSRIKPEAFVRDILRDRLKIKLAVAGFDYRFGYRGEGDAEYLKKLGRKYGFRVIVIPPVRIDYEIVSSTLIRNYVAKGDMEKVFRLLGRHYSITGNVADGKKIGSRIGFPTANIHPENDLILPHEGVYITKTLLEDRLYPGITNVGRNPTFGAKNPVSVETHLLDFDAHIYGKKIEVFFIARLRGEKRFKSEEELRLRIREDIAAAREFFKV